MVWGRRVDSWHFGTPQPKYMMNMNKRLALFLAGVFLILAARARALPLVSIESGCLWQVSSASFTSVTSKTVDVMGYGSVGYSSITANAYGIDYTIYAKGADATYSVVQTTKTPSSAASATAFNNSAPMDQAASVAVLSTSTAVTVPANVWWPTRFGAVTKNPVFYLTSLTNTATYYVQTTYCAQQRP